MNYPSHHKSLYEPLMFAFLSSARSAALAASSRPAFRRLLRGSTTSARPRQRVTRGGCYATMTEPSISAYLPSDTYNSLPKVRRRAGRRMARHFTCGMSSREAATHKVLYHCEVTDVTTPPSNPVALSYSEDGEVTYLHTMLRVNDLDKTMAFFNAIGKAVQVDIRLTPR